MVYILFIWLLLLSIVFVKLIHAVVCISSSHCHRVFHYKNILQLSVLLLMNICVVFSLGPLQIVV